MTESVHPIHKHPFVRKIESIALFTLSVDERAALFALPMQVAQVGAYQDIVREGDRPSRCFTVLEGVACTYKSTQAGKRRVMAYHVAGDVPDFQSLHLKVLDISIATVSPCQVGFVQHDAVRALLRSHPRVGEALWRATLIDAAIVREWMLNTGRRDSYARMAHLFCELITRLDSVGLSPDRTCDLPMTQPELADALGITPVHVNRTIRDLKTAGLITLRNRRLTVHDWDGLTAAAEFDPTYLHLSKREAT
ncbi:Crp/Fnr family transcriptional regulator [Methylobacterium sp. NEAU K]|uniref:Crp/Fnr family transcriptional regulator n=1 Tax=Methylobacterium sp. NEAU K TaxID=3064946 RepID=UPI002732981E|nr:Crp/Fnr family transcriptional regulator [Methylobacterium sp. NEAU K]MDP4005597.1 Crp/Fnr family transcriptional regulator [Methylobacterium sp. NEAU K]